MGILDRWFSKSAEQPPRAVASGRAPFQRPEPKTRNHYVVLVLDSCRFDTFMAAKPANALRLGEVEKRFSYASWTAPSHYNLLMGLLPHSSPPHVFASDYYKEDFHNYNHRLGCEDMEFGRLVPSLYLPTLLRRELGYTTHARVSLPVLNPATPLNRDFDSFQLMDAHNDMAAMLDTLTFIDERPSYYLLNVGETHYPYATPDEDPADWPQVSGENGVFRALDPQNVGGKLIAESEAPREFDQAKLDQLKARQIEAVKHVDGVIGKLFDLVPKNTFVTITSDHGELFGEGGYFGHGPILHDKVFEVPFVEGLVR